MSSAVADPPAGRSVRPSWMDVDWRAHLRWVEVRGRPVNVLDVNPDPARPAVVFLHGLSGCWQNWLESIAPLAADHRVIAIDLPGFGESPMPAEPISVSGYARIVVELLDALGVQRATIAGNSMGGFVGCEIAIRFPARVQRLVLVAAAGLSLRHMRHERKRGLRARAENLLFFGLGRLAARTGLVVRSRRLRRGLLCSSPRTPTACPARSSSSRPMAPASRASTTRSRR